MRCFGCHENLGNIRITRAMEAVKPKFKPENVRIGGKVGVWVTGNRQEEEEGCAQNHGRWRQKADGRPEEDPNEFYGSGGRGQHDSQRRQRPRFPSRQGFTFSDPVNAAYTANMYTVAGPSETRSKLSLIRYCWHLHGPCQNGVYDSYRLLRQSRRSRIRFWPRNRTVNIFFISWTPRDSW